MKQISEQLKKDLAKKEDENKELQTNLENKTEQLMDMDYKKKYFE